MDFASMLPVVLPIALFVVTLIIVFTLRASDKHSKSLSNVKRLLDIYILRGVASQDDACLKNITVIYGLARSACLWLGDQEDRSIGTF